MNKQTVFITGASSFLGKRLVELLPKDEYEIIQTALHGDENNNIIKLDLTAIDDIRDIIADNPPDIVIHIGALVDLSRDFEVGNKCIEVNTLGTMYLLEAIKEVQPFVLYVSSEEVYGDGPLPFSEDQKISPPSPYAISKAAGEYFCRWYGSEYHFPTSIVRLGTFYGPGQPEHKYFARVIRHAMANEPIPCNSGGKKRDYLYIDDAIELLVQILHRYVTQYSTKEPHMILNCTGGKPYQLLSIIEKIQQLTHSTSEVQLGVIPDRITERDEWRADISKAKKLFDWTPKTSIEEGLRKMVEHYKKETNV